MAHGWLSNCAAELGAVARVPGDSGVYEIRVGHKLVWSRATDGGFPDVKLLKQRVRDCIAPGHDLGHIDRPS